MPHVAVLQTKLAESNHDPNSDHLRPNVMDAGKTLENGFFENQAGNVRRIRCLSCDWLLWLEYLEKWISADKISIRQEWGQCIKTQKRSGLGCSMSRKIYRCNKCLNNLTVKKRGGPPRTRFACWQPSRVVPDVILEVRCGFPLCTRQLQSHRHRLMSCFPTTFAVGDT